jgi:hypothetical protein
MSHASERLPMPDGWPDPLVDECLWPRGPCERCGNETAVRADAGIDRTLSGERKFLCEECMGEE